MRERRYWYATAAIVLIVGVLLAWKGPLSGGICLPKEIVRPRVGPLDPGRGCLGEIGVIIALASVALAVILAFVGFLRDPPD